MTPIQEFPTLYAVLVADLTEKTARGYPFWYAFFDNLGSFEGKDPNTVLDPYAPWNREDPTDESAPQPANTNSGYIAIQPASDSWDEAVPKLAVTLTFTWTDGDSKRISFHHVDPGARAAERTIGFQAQPLKNVLIASHRQPIPSTFYDAANPRGAVWKQAVDLFKEDGTGELADAIRTYFQNTDAAGMAARIQARDAISRMLHFPWDSSAPHAHRLNLLLARIACENGLAFGGKTYSYRGWLVAIAFEEHTRGHVSPPGFSKLYAGAKIYRYVCEFDSKSVGKTLYPILKGVVGGFQVRVRLLVAPIAADGGAPDFTDDAGNANVYYGAFLELKAGFGDPPGLPSEIYFDSYEQMSPKDLNGAFFELYAADAAIKAEGGFHTNGLGWHVGGESKGQSFLMRLHVRGQVLEGAFNEANVIPKWDSSWGKRNPDLGALKRIFSSRGIAKDSDFFKFDYGKPKVSLGISLGIGYIGAQTAFRDWMRAPPAVGSGLRSVSDGRTVTAMFEANKAEIRDKVQGWRVRFLLETVLATDLALYTGGAEVDVRGSASPEYTPCYNLVLSQQRAMAVKYAFCDAIPILDDSQVTVVGLGDTLALSEQLHRPDPTGKPDDRASFPYKEEIEKWPEYRRVDVDVMGRFSVRVITVDGEDA
ncbi:MAG: hypothetical protein M3O50_17975 [Myxococcota bacterium]|nr:hypothetical protein [Myxococcota bacterium]